MRVGVIGTGTMGRPIAVNCLAANSDAIYADLKKCVATLLEKSSAPSPKN